MNKPNLEELCAYWQRSLRLQDWRISVSYEPNLTASDGSPVYGLCSRLVDNRTATILIRDPETPVQGAAQKDPEEILLHELVHLHFAAFGTSTPAEVAAEEQSVWSLAEALYRNKGTPKEQMMTRAMVAASRVDRGQCGRGERRMDPMVIAALEAALEAEDPKKAIQALLEKIKTMEPEKAPASERGEGQAQRAAEPPPAKEPAKPEAMEPSNARAAKAGVGADEAAKIAERSARAVIAEHEERRALIEGNREALGTKLAAHLYTQPLSAVKAMVAARLADVAETNKGGAQRAARVAVDPVGGSSVDSETAAALKLVNRHMGLDADNVKAFEVDGQGGIRISHVAREPFDMNMVQKLAGAGGKGA